MHRVLFRIIVFVLVPGAIYYAPALAADAESEYKTALRIKVLSGDGDLRSAGIMAKKLGEMGYEIETIDHAPRANFPENTLYFAAKHQKQAEDIAAESGSINILKLLTWSSVFDLILVTGRTQKEKGKAVLITSHEALEKEQATEASGKKTAYLSGEAIKAIAEKAGKTAGKRFTGEKKTYPGRKQTKISLDEAVKIAVANNALIKEANENLKGANEERKSALADYFPKLSAEYSYTRLNEAPTLDFPSIALPGFTIPGMEVALGDEEMYKWNLTLTQPLFTGFAIYNKHRLAKLGVDIEEFNRELAILDVVKDVKRAYFGLLMAKKFAGMADDAVENLKSHEKDAEKIYKEGIIPYNDLLKAKVALANVVQQREKAKASEKIAMSALNILLDFDIDKKIEIEDIRTTPATSYKIPDVIDMAMANRPELKLLNLTIKSLGYGSKLVKSAYLPQIAAVGRYEQTGTDIQATENEYGDVQNSVMLIQAKWSLFEGGKTRADAAKYRYSKRALMKKYEWIEKGIKLEIKNAFSNLQVSEKNIHTAKSSLAQAKENWRITNLQYREQIASSTEVLDARTFLTQAETNYYSALYGYMISLADLERAMGISIKEKVAVEPPRQKETTQRGTDHTEILVPSWPD